jgi:hypothetical protein
LQATSCSSERTFSVRGDTIAAKKCLHPENVHMVYIRDNLKKVKLDGLILDDPLEEKKDGLTEEEH